MCTAYLICIPEFMVSAPVPKPIMNTKLKKKVRASFQLVQFQGFEELQNNNKKAEEISVL